MRVVMFCPAVSQTTALVELLNEVERLRPLSKEGGLLGLAASESAGTSCRAAGATAGGGGSDGGGGGGEGGGGGGDDGGGGGGGGSGRSVARVALLDGAVAAWNRYRHFRARRVLGRGAYGRAVLLCGPGAERAVAKQFWVGGMDARALERVEREIHLLASVRHAHVIAYAPPIQISRQWAPC